MIFDHHYLTIGGVDYLTDVDARDVQPTAYAPATLTYSQATGLDDPDAARLTVPVTVPIENDGRTLRTNPIRNPSFESSTSFWALSGGTLSRTTAFPSMWLDLGGRSGDHMAQATADGTSPYLTMSTLSAHDFAVSPGQWIAVAVLVAGDSFGGQPGSGIRSDVVCLGSATTFHSSGAFTPAPWYPGSRIVYAFQVPATGSTARLRIQAHTGDSGTNIASGQRMWVDAAIAAVTWSEAESLAQVQKFFDGSTPDTPTRTYSWTDAEDASPSIEVAPDLRPSIGDAVEVEVSPFDDGAQPLATFVGEVESLQRREVTMRRRDGSTFDTVMYQVAATDRLGSLARRRLADTPWPREPVALRWGRICALLPDVTIEDPPRADQSGVDCAPRDVDNVPALELLRDTIALVDGVVQDFGGFGIVGENREVAAPPTNDPFAMLHLPGAAFESPEDVIDYDLSINAARVNGKQLDAGEVKDATFTAINAPARATYGESAWSVSGDGMAPTGGTLADTLTGQRAARLVNDAGEPAWRLDGAVTAIPHVLAGYLTAGGDYTGAVSTIIRGGLGRCVTFDGAPPGRDVFRIVGVRLTWGGPEAFEIEVEPPQMVAALPYED